MEDKWYQFSYMGLGIYPSFPILFALASSVLSSDIAVIQIISNHTQTLTVKKNEREERLHSLLCKILLPLASSPPSSNIADLTTWRCMTTDS